MAAGQLGWLLSGCYPACADPLVGRESTAKLLKMLVLPVRIELTTSALPRMRSTTELRQQGTSMLVPKSARTPGKARLWTSKRGRSRNLPWQKTIPSGRRGWPKRCERICGVGKCRRARRRIRARRAIRQSPTVRSRFPVLLPAKAGIHEQMGMRPWLCGRGWMIPASAGVTEWAVAKAARSRP